MEIADKIEVPRLEKIQNKGNRTVILILLCLITMGYFISTIMVDYSAETATIALFSFVVVPIVAPFLAIVVTSESVGNDYKEGFMGLLIVLAIFSFSITGTAVVRLQDIGNGRFNHIVSSYDEENLKNKIFYIHLKDTFMQNKRSSLKMSQGVFRANDYTAEQKFTWQQGKLCLENRCLSVEPQTGEVTENSKYFGKITQVFEKEIN